MLDGVKVAFCNLGMKAEAARPCANDRKEWRSLLHVKLNKFLAAISLALVFFRTALPCCGAYHLERGGMPLHDAVGINCKNDETMKNQGAVVKYMV